MYRKLELAFLRLEHWVIHLFGLSRMSYNLLWLASGLMVFVGFLGVWIVSLHARPDTEYILIRDSSITGGHAEVYYEGNSFYFRPLQGKVFFNNQEITHSAPLKEGDQFILGHTILQLQDTTGWLPKLKVIGYYLDEQLLSLEKISIGRSDRPEEENNWKLNDIVISDTSFEPVQLWIYPEKDFSFLVQNRGLRSVQVAHSDTQGWITVRHVEPLKVGDKIKVGESIFQLTRYRTGRGVGLYVLRGQTQSYRIYLHKRNVLSGSHTIPGGYIPDILVDEEFLENVRRCLEARLIYLVNEGTGSEDGSLRTPQGDLRAFIRVRGFTKDGKLMETDFNSLTNREKRLLEQTFRFSPREGSQLKWRRPFNRNREDPYLFDGTELENFIIKDGDLKGIYNFAARLVSPHTLQEELSIQRGSIYDRDQKTLPRLVLSDLELNKTESGDGKLQADLSKIQFLLVNEEDRSTVIDINLNKPLEDKIYVASGYIFTPDKESEIIREDQRVAATTLNPKPPVKGRVIVKRVADQVKLALGCSPSKPTGSGVSDLVIQDSESGVLDLSFSPNLLSDYTCVEEKILREGEVFEIGSKSFTYLAAGSGFLAKNVQPGIKEQQAKDGKQPATSNEQRRYYPLGEKSVHIIGYSYAKSNFKGNLEQVLDDVLLGKERMCPWYEIACRRGRPRGNNVILTLDDDLQQIIYEALKKKLDELNQNIPGGQKVKESRIQDEGPDVESEEYSKFNIFRGAAVAINSEGEILAAVSIPAYNPHNIHSILAALKESSLDNWNSSFINRALHKTYPPGSTFKVIMSSLALENKNELLWESRDYLIKAGAGGFFCTGLLSSFEGERLGYPIPDFRGGRHGGPLTLGEALAKSCNNAFAFLALRAGRDLITEYAERFGFNQSYDLLPTSLFEGDIETRRLINRSEGDTLFVLKSPVPIPAEELHISKVARMGIGQWEIQATPLEMALVAITIGNSGLRPYPHLIKGIEDGETGKIRYFHYPDKERVLSPEAADTLKSMMQKVVQEGTAVRISMSKVPYYSLKDHVVGKTGTAEVEGENRKKANIAWFISLAPVEAPKLAIAIVIEKGAIISREPVMVARDIWEKAVLLYRDQFPQTELLDPSDNSGASKSQGSIGNQRRRESGTSRQNSPRR